MKTPYLYQWLIVIRMAAWRKIKPLSMVLETPEPAIKHFNGRAY